MTFLLALFLAFAKRRDDVVIYEESGVKVRKNVNRYNVAFMNQAIGIVAGITMICYIMYTVTPDVMERLGILPFHKWPHLLTYWCFGFVTAAIDVAIFTSLVKYWGVYYILANCISR